MKVGELYLKIFKKNRFAMHWSTSSYVWLFYSNVVLKKIC